MKRTIAQACKKIVDSKRNYIAKLSLFEEAKQNVEMRGLDPDKEWILIDKALPQGSVLLKTTSGIVVIGDLYENKWRVDGHWRRVNGQWESDYKFNDMAFWRNIPL